MRCERSGLRLFRTLHGPFFPSLRIFPVISMPTKLKPPERRQRRNARWGAQLVRSAQVEAVPEAPRDLLRVTRELWKSYWASAVAEVVERATDLPAIRRLFTLHDERERAYRAYRKDRLVEGSKGQPVVNPIARQMSSMDAEIRQLEDRLGLTPKARAQLGVTFGKAQRSLEDLNRELAGEEL